MGGNLMRTVTFADQKLIDSIRESVVPVWNNQNPDPNDLAAELQKQPKPTATEAATYPQGGGGTNVLAFFCDPEGNIFHYTKGYWSPKNFLEEIEFAKGQFKLIAANDKAEGKPATKTIKLPKEKLVVQIEKRIELLSKLRADLKSEHPAEMKKPFPESEIRRRHAWIGLQIASCHEARSLCDVEIKAKLNELLQQNLHHGIVS